MEPIRSAGHVRFSHDSIADLGSDWSRVGRPDLPREPPFKVYFPRTTDEVLAAVREANMFGQSLVIRGSGHSSNNLVISNRGNMLCMRGMTGIVDVDVPGAIVSVRAGSSLLEVDRAIADYGLGLPVVGDHSHITVGGFASVGGVSPASHRFGLFVDTIAQIEYVTFDGRLEVCSRRDGRAALLRLLAGCGRHGIMTTVTIDALRVDKRRELLVNDRRTYRDLDAFVDDGRQLMSDAGRFRMQRGYWIDLPPRRGITGFGTWSNYSEGKYVTAGTVRRRAGHVVRTALGQALPKLPRPIDKIGQAIGVGAMALAPTYQTIQDVEAVTDLVLDQSMGNPLCWFGLWVPLTDYGTAFGEVLGLFRQYRERTGCFTVLAVMTQAIRSPYLTAAGGHDAYGLLLVNCGVDRRHYPDDLADRLAVDLDRLCADLDGLRYLHTPTSTDAELLRRVDPNRRLHDSMPAGAGE